MYPSRATLSGEPPGPDASGNPPGSVLDVTVALPVTGQGILDRTDPLCDQPSPADGTEHVYRGGCWDITAQLSTSASREGISDGATSGLIGLGFRCARPAMGP
jgi:hypothetical protein